MANPNDKIAHFAYEDSLKAYRDLKNVKDTAFEEGKAEGLKVGKAEGLKAGKAAMQQEIAHNLLKAGYPLKEVSAITHIPIHELERLAK